MNNSDIAKSLSPRTNDFHKEVKKKGLKILGKGNHHGEYADMIKSVSVKLGQEEYAQQRDEKLSEKKRNQSANSLANPRWALKGNFVNGSQDKTQ